jgi:hypothetical protein
VDAEVAEDHVGRKIVAHELLYGRGEQDLPAVARCQQPREPIQWCRKVVAILRVGLPRV